MRKSRREGSGDYADEKTENRCTDLSFSLSFPPSASSRLEYKTPDEMKGACRAREESEKL